MLTQLVWDIVQTRVHGRRLYIQYLVQTRVMIPKVMDSGSKVYGRVYHMHVSSCVSY
jgi:hypothetical protein